VVGSSVATSSVSALPDNFENRPSRYASRNCCRGLLTERGCCRLLGSDKFKFPVYRPPRLPPRVVGHQLLARRALYLFQCHFCLLVNAHCNNIMPSKHPFLISPPHVFSSSQSVGLHTS